MSEIRIALAGNPNCGKTTLFNALTGSNQYVGNWPGVTVEKKEGKLKGHADVTIQDLPGIYSLSPYTLEEVVSRNYLVGDKPDHKIRDDIAVELVEKIDYDFSKADQDMVMYSGVIARTIVLDQMVRQYLENHKNTIVINIACGLDTRCYRMQGKYLRWYNVDLPETMNLRSRFLSETGPVYQIAKSAMDETYVDEITFHNEDVLVIIEGLTMYLKEDDVKKMFSIIDQSFQNVTVMVETMSPFVVKHVKEKSIAGSNAKFTWGIKNGKQLQDLLSDFTFQNEVSLVEGMKELHPMYRVIGKIPAVRNISNKIIVLKTTERN